MQVDTAWRVEVDRKTTFLAPKALPLRMHRFSALKTLDLHELEGGRQDGGSVAQLSSLQHLILCSNFEADYASAPLLTMHPSLP